MRTQCLAVVAALLGLGCQSLFGQPSQRHLVDVHVHHNGEKAFLQQMQGRIQGSFFELEHIPAAVGSFLDNLVAVHVALR